MAYLPTELYKDVADQLAPLMQTVGERQASVPPGLSGGIAARIEWEGATDEFIVRLVRLLPHGVLIELLQYNRNRIGVMQQFNLDRLCERINALRPTEDFAEDPLTAYHEPLVRELADNPRYQLDRRLVEITVEIRTLLEAAEKQLKTIASYKDIHELLQKLQRVLDVITQVEHLPSAGIEDRWRNLEWHTSELEDGIRLLQKSAIDPDIPLPSLRLWVEPVGEQVSKLRLLIKGRNDADIHLPCEAIRSILTKGASRIDHDISNLAQNLQIRDLEKAIQSLSQRLITSNLVSPNTLRELQTVAGEISSRNSVFVSLVRQHHDWQDAVDAILVIERLIRHGLNPAEDWRESRCFVEQMLREQENKSWVSVLRSDLDDIEASVTEGDLTKLRNHFRNFRSRLNGRFDQFDSQLKVQCTVLMRMKSPLLDVLPML